MPMGVVSGAPSPYGGSSKVAKYYSTSHNLHNVEYDYMRKTPANIG